MSLEYYRLLNEQENMRDKMRIIPDAKEASVFKRLFRMTRNKLTEYENGTKNRQIQT